MKCVAMDKDGNHLTPRRSTGNMYQSRSTWSSDIDDAKIFNTKSAAKN